ncbi:peptidase M16 protein [Actibacterium atlanticum]|uniref:Peptidase M16 protein n=1 Tax=Actibacterium atlanticum TaxID=1461693 RepID=A0A058ZN88_9RHOB|nr:pitrilysin family protein [Actibacterium atlanticum]KCV82685.1 peptidase M16 protein [Actibacterium atlanticum]
MIRFALTAAFAALVALPVQADVDIQEITSPGGITAWLVEAPEIPIVSLELRFKGGASLDAPGKTGAINLMAGLLEEGAGDLDARGFAKARDAMAASFSFDVSRDAMSVSAQFLTETQDAAVDLLHMALVDPKFEDAALERVRSQVMSSLRSDLKDPDTIAARAFRELAFPDHPYGLPTEGTLETVEALTRDDLLSAKARVMARDRLVVSAVGDIDAETLGALLDKLVDGLPETGAPMPQDVIYDLAGGVQVVPFDTPQSVAIFGQRGIKRDDPDFFAAFILNSVVGAGGLTSRLMEEVREKRGLTYGVYSYLASFDHAEIIMGQVASANDRVAEAVDVIRAEWAKAASKGLSAEELERAKTYLTGAYPLRFDGNGRIANILAGMQLDGLGLDYIATRNDKVRAVTLEDVNRVAAELLDPENLFFVVVGQPEGLESTN